MGFCPPVTVGRRVETGMAERRIRPGEEDDRALDFGTSNGVVELMFIALFMGLKSGDKRRRYLRTGSFDFFVGDDSGVFERLGVFEGVVGPVVGVACVVKVVSWS